MRPEDVLAFTKSKIETFSERHAKSYNEFEEFVKKRESSFLYRIFRMKYERGFCEYWDFDTLRDWIDDMKEIERTAEYYKKLRSEDMYQKFPKNWRVSFYNWCKENNIPY